MGPPPGESGLRVADARIWLERNLAQEADHADPAPPADLVPQEVRRHRRDDADQEEQTEVELSHAGQRAGREHDGDRGYGHAQLIPEDPEGEDQVSVLDQESRQRLDVSTSRVSGLRVKNNDALRRPAR